MIPGATINVIVKASRFALGRPPIPTAVAGWAPTIIGLGSIPLIIHPIDDAVDYLLDNTTRKILSETFDFDASSWTHYFTEPTSTATDKSDKKKR